MTTLDRAMPVLTVADVSAAVDEYQTLLGVDLLMNHGWIATLGTAGRAEFSVMSRDLTAPVNPTMSLQVPDVDVVYARMMREGAEVVHPLQDEEWGVRRFFLRTRDGHVVNVLSHLG